MKRSTQFFFGYDNHSQVWWVEQGVIYVDQYMVRHGPINLSSQGTACWAVFADADETLQVTLINQL